MVFQNVFQSTGLLLLGGGVCGCLGVIIFAIWGNKDKWLPEHANNFFGKRKKLILKIEKLLNFSFISGWSFILGVIGAIGLIASASFFLTEATVQKKKVAQLKDSQARFELERAAKA